MPLVETLPNGSRLSCGRLARWRKTVGRQSVPRQGHNTPLPLKRSPPVSFKRLLGSTIGMVAATPPAPHTNTNEENQEQYGGGEEPAGRQPQDRTGQSRRSCLGNALDHWVHSVVLPNGSRLSCGRRARRRKDVGRQSVPTRAQHSDSIKAITARQLQALVRQHLPTTITWNSTLHR